jgi:hypothetical protein
MRLWEAEVPLEHLLPVEVQTFSLAARRCCMQAIARRFRKAPAMGTT